MIKKVLILLFGLSLCLTCLTNGFAEEVPEPILEFPVPEGDAYIQGTEDIKRAPNFIFGKPDFEKMRDLPKNSQDYQLGRKVAYLFTAFEPRAPFGFVCTGFLVGPDLLMTNHHCVHDDFGRPAPLELIAVYMDYYQEREDDPTRGGVTARVVAIIKADARLDYALLRLDKPIGNTYGWLELDTTTPATPGRSVKIIHHSSGRSKEISRRNSEIVEVPANIAARNPFLIAYLADTEGGSSGSPVFLRNGTGVIGINHSGWFNRDGPIFNGGSLMSWIVPQIEQWLPRRAAPDLVAEFPRVDKEFLRPGESFTLSVTVRNQGATASPTPLRYYYSTDNTISSTDAPLGDPDIVDSLPTDGSIEKSITLTAPDYIGTYYYGACVDPTANETATYNNCSPAVSVNVSTIPPFWMYWAARDAILRATPEGTHLQTLVDGLNPRTRGIALNDTIGKMYWTDGYAGKIQRANFDGTNVEDVIIGLSEPSAIALDVAAGKIYWTVFGKGPRKIQRANFDGSNVEDLVTGLAGSPGIALDVAAGKMYWTDLFRIQRANLDGTNVEDVITGEFFSAIALDVFDNKMYWSKIVGPANIQRANFDGSNVEDLVTGLDAPLGLALDVAAGKMYWTDLNANKIQRANLDGSNLETLFADQNASGIALRIPQPDGMLTFSPNIIPNQTFTVGTPVNLFLSVARGGTPPYRYTLSPIPGGLVFDASARELRGTPTTAIPATRVTYTATDASDASASLTFTITVRAKPTFNPSVIADQTFTVGKAVNLTLPVATGGTPPYTYTLAPLPGGLSFNPTQRLLSGTPTTVETTTATYTATDTANLSVSLTFTIEVTEGVILDVNGDGQVTVMDLVAVALFYGIQLPDGINLRADVNADGVVNVLDLVAVAQGIDAASSGNGVSLQAVEAALAAAAEQAAEIEAIAEAPNALSGGTLAYRNVAAALADARLDKRIPETVLQALLHLLAEMREIPDTTALLPNYPNPFNPETWLPYELATPASVKLSIHSVAGRLVRTLDVGHQPAGIYRSKHRAAYWDGKNQHGEKVASGIYFYTLTAGDFTATRKLLIAK